MRRRVEVLEHAAGVEPEVGLVFVAEHDDGRRGGAAKFDPVAELDDAQLESGVITAVARDAHLVVARRPAGTAVSEGSRGRAEDHDADDGDESEDAPDRGMNESHT